MQPRVWGQGGRSKAQSQIRGRARRPARDEISNSKQMARKGSSGSIWGGGPARQAELVAFSTDGGLQAGRAAAGTHPIAADAFGWADSGGAAAFGAVDIMGRVRRGRAVQNPNRSSLQPSPTNTHTHLPLTHPKCTGPALHESSIPSSSTIPRHERSRYALLHRRNVQWHARSFLYHPGHDDLLR